jgi:hypothetical protein
MSFLYRFWDGLVNLILPASEETGMRAMSRGLRWILHALLLLALLALLYWLNSPSVLNMPEKLPGYPAWVKHGWLPILFVLFYVLCWLGWWLWKLLSSEEERPDFPDITKAWQEARETLSRQGIDLRDLPLFLVLGRPEGSTRNLFDSAKMQFTVKMAPSREEAPLHVWATATALYVSCEGCSLVGRHAVYLAGGMGGDTADEGPGGDDSTATMSGKTLMPGTAGGGVSEIQQLLDQAAKQRRQLTAAEKRQIRSLSRKDRGYPAPVRNPEDKERITARFEHFCRLLVRDRWPYCPVNGVLVLVPDAATDSDQDAADTGGTVRHDLAVARRVLQVNCPVLTLVCDLETGHGFEAFVGRFNEKERKQRVGQRFPLVPDLSGRSGRGGHDPEEARARVLESLARWVCGGVVPGWVYKNFEMEKPGGDRSGAVTSNGRLFLFMHQLWERRQRLGRVLAAGLATPDGEAPAMYGGCYIGGTGGDGGNEQAFVPGLFKRLSDEENNLAWTAAAMEEEEKYNRWVGIAQTILAVLGLAVVGLLGYMIFGQQGPAKPKSS